MFYRLLILVVVLAVPATARAVETVNSTDDTDDGNCDAHCTLREAINAVSDNETINFSFTGTSAVRTITLGSALPAQTNSGVLIDGFDCTGCGTVAPNTNTPDQGFNSSLGIVLDGPGTGSTAVMRITGASTTVQGLVFSNASADALEVDANNVVVTGCYIGTDVTGITSAGGGDDGIYINDSSGITIGPYNLLSGNTEDGLLIRGNTDQITVIGNIIGMDVTGLVGMGNGDSGIRVDGTGEGQDLNIGGVASADRNVISGNGLHGIYIHKDHDGDKGTGTGSFIQGNTIGLTADGLATAANAGDGIRFLGTSAGKADHVTIQNNLISGNVGSGLHFEATEAHIVKGNYIGTNVAGASLGNAVGISLVSDQDHHTKKMEIGDLTRTTPANQNEIAFNTGEGVLMNKLAGAAEETKENEIGANSIHHNGGLGIEILEGASGAGAASPAANVNCNTSNNNAFGNRGIGKPILLEADHTGGVLTGGVLTGGTVTVDGTSCDNATVDIYLVDDPANANGQPEVFLATTTANGSGVWSVILAPGAVLVADELTAMQTDSEFETSEAGDNIVVTTCDADGDGFNDINLTSCPSNTDCDDTDPLTFPGATELCDGLDNDCDLSVPANELDVDLDTYLACAECDDNAFAVNPGATEACNIIDDNCDGAIDEGFDVDVDTYTTCGADGIPGTADDDCNDNAFAVNPGATEACNIIDDNCDGAIDEGFDVDVDTYTTCGADGIPGTADDDCDDNAFAVNPGATEACNLIDDNCDVAIDEGFDVDTDTFSTCGADGITGTADDDCDDTDITVFPGATEVCNAVDDDCDATIDDGFDTDIDTFTTCGADGITGNTDDDCDDNAAAVFPGALELCNGIDDNCDGNIDENLDVDLDGVTNCDGDCDDNNNTVFPGAPELCDGLDNDCDTLLPVDEQDLDGDLVLACDDDCDDNEVTVYGGAVELCDGLDNDCDGGIPSDELDADLDLQSPCDGDCDDNDATIFLGAEEVCSDGIDQDCDGVDADDLDVDGDLWSECEGDCDDDNADVNPGAAEVCDDGLDNDCDGRVLDSSDSDEDGVSACDGDCDDDDPDVFPGQEEFCNELDDDCDDLVDEDALDLDLDGYDDCEDCDDDRDDVHPAAEELCDGLDGDCDGTVPADELDADGDTYLGCGGDCDDDSADVNPDGVEVCGDGIDQDCDAADLPCAGGIILGTPDEPEASCASSVAGHAGPGALALLLLVGLARRRRMAPALGLLLLGCSGPVGPVSVQTWWGGQDSDEDVFFEAGGAFDAVALSSSFEADGSLWVEVALVGAEVDCVGYGNYRSRAADITVEIAAALADSDTRLGAVEDVVGLACQELDGAAREAFGWDGSHRALHLLARGDGDGSFLPSSAAPVGPVLSELPQDGFFASRYVEWGGLGAGLLPGGDGSESGYEACVGRLTNVFQAWDAGELGDVPSEAMAAWGLSGRRAEHHDPALEEVSHEEGSSSPVGVFFGRWSGPSSPGATLRVTSFVGLQDVPEGVDFARAALGVEAGSALESCPDLAGSEVAVWPEPGLVGQGGEP